MGLIPVTCCQPFSLAPGSSLTRRYSYQLWNGDQEGAFLSSFFCPGCLPPALLAMPGVPNKSSWVSTALRDQGSMRRLGCGEQRCWMCLGLTEQGGLLSRDPSSRRQEPYLICPWSGRLACLGARGRGCFGDQGADWMNRQF